MALGRILLFAALLSTAPSMSAPAADDLIPVGVARVDVTPAEPIRLTGYGGRRTPSEGIEQKLWAKVLALGGDAEGATLWITLDNCGIAEGTAEEIAKRLAKSGRIARERIVVCSSHTHSGPATTDWAPNIFSQDISGPDQAAIDRYTRTLIDQLEQAGLAALKDRRPARLSWAQGRAGFARNRRAVAGKTARLGDNATGPADTTLPLLKIENPDGTVRAFVANYACHCTTLGGEFNKVCGDWAGYAQEALEREFPGTTALVTIGCGADANPSPRGGADGGLAFARQNGEAIAAEVKRLMAFQFTPLHGPLDARMKRLELPFAPHFTREQWTERAKQGGIVGYHAKKNLARLDRGETLPQTLSYWIQVWNFGDDLALVFLNGEVVVDYALRLKQEFDPTRLWVTAYAGYVPCYIPSRRILQEGGYEAEDSLWYYDRPARLAPATEDLIINATRDLVPKSFAVDQKKAEFPDAKSPAQSLACLRTKADLTVELVATEPFVQSPVAIDWSTDGRLWVCEMFDYPTGLDGQYRPGGRIKVLSDTDGDGRYDKATLFVDGLAFPTGVTPWNKGALICAAPDILFAEDTDGDGRADVVRTNYTGFATHNYQARVNGFTWGLDGWLHGSSGLFGGKIRNLITGEQVDLSGRDFRLHPETGRIEPVAGLSQMGRVRDDWDHWFGNDNSTLLWHYPLPEHYLRRNAHVSYPNPRVNVATGDDPNRLFPRSRTLERFNDPHTANRVTGACGPEIYRDVLLGSNYYGNAFICEPVHNLVRRMVLEPAGVTFAGRRADDETSAEFLASTDNWFRPVQVRTGPDGALWIVDMYRFVIEHPRWIPTNRLAQLDVRAGAEQGRIYRIYPRSAPPRPVRDLTKLPLIGLAVAVNTPNGPTRDLVHREFVQRRPEAEFRSGEGAERRFQTHLNTLSVTASKSPSAAVTLQALSILRDLGAMRPGQAEKFAHATVPEFLSGIIALAEPFFSNTLSLQMTAFEWVDHPDPRVRFQLALSLGAWRDPKSADMLGSLLKRGTDDRWFRAALLSSSTAWPERVLSAVLRTPGEAGPNSELVAPLLASVAALRPPDVMRETLRAVAPDGILTNAWQFEAFSAAFEAAQRVNADWRTNWDATVLQQARDSASRAVASEAQPGAIRVAAARLAGWCGERDADFATLRLLLREPLSDALRQAVFRALGHQRDAEGGTALLADWIHFSPKTRRGAVTALLTRKEWSGALLAAVEAGTVSRDEIAPPERTQLAQHADPALAARAQNLFAVPHAGSRAEAVERFRASSSLTGAAPRGGPLFDQQCAQCHARHGHGHAVGPDLAEFAGKSFEDFVVAIIDPNAALNPNFTGYTADLRDGRSFTGVLRGESATGFTILQAGGVEEKILRADLKELRASAISLMPEGLEQAFQPQDLADLIAWLKAATPPPTSATAGGVKP